MADLNSWSITGRLTANADYKVLASGKGLLTANVAVNTGFGEYQKTTYVKVQQWGERGKNIVQYLNKGNLIACSGELSTNEWSTREGEKRVDLQLTVNSIQMLSSAKRNEASDTTDQPSSYDEEEGDVKF